MQYLTPSEKEKLLRAVYSETGKHRKRNIAIFEVGLYCALRVSEIKGLKVACYDWDRKTLFCYRLKGSHANTIKIVDLHVVKALEDYLKERTERGIDSPYLSAHSWVIKIAEDMLYNRLSTVSINSFTEAKYPRCYDWTEENKINEPCQLSIELGF